MIEYMILLWICLCLFFFSYDRPFQMSSITFACVGAYKDGVDQTCDSVDASIKVRYII